VATSLSQVGQNTNLASNGNGFNCFNLADDFKLHSYSLAYIRKQGKIVVTKLANDVRQMLPATPPRRQYPEMEEMCSIIPHHPQSRVIASK
jgi:hypothetical protein